MKEISLTQGQVTLVDDEDYNKLVGHKWCAWWNHSTRSFYAVRNQYVDGKRRIVYMARIITDAQSGQDVDHRNHNTLDNRHSNLRACTRSENMCNQRKQPGHSSIFKGVYWHKQRGKWAVHIGRRGHSRYIGIFINEIDAAKAYDAAARCRFGEFASTNFPEDASDDHD